MIFYETILRILSFYIVELTYPYFRSTIFLQKVRTGLDPDLQGRGVHPRCYRDRRNVDQDYQA